MLERSVDFELNRTDRNLLLIHPAACANALNNVNTTLLLVVSPLHSLLLKRISVIPWSERLATYWSYGLKERIIHGLKNSHFLLGSKADELQQDSCWQVTSRRHKCGD